MSTGDVVFPTYYFLQNIPELYNIRCILVTVVIILVLYQFLFPGVHGSRFITTHGVSLNCDTDLSWFKHIVPCGLEGKDVTSLSKELNKDITINNTIPFFLDAFQQKFDCDIDETFLQDHDLSILPTRENLEKIEKLHDMSGENVEVNEEKVRGVTAE